MGAFVASTVVPLIGRLRPLYGARSHPVRACRSVARNSLIQLTLLAMRGPRLPGRFDDSPCFPAFTGAGELRRTRRKIIVAKVDTGANPRQS
jgi:hypothetical protein